MIKKIYAFGPAARKKLLRGAAVVGELVSATLGPKGRNSIIQTPYSAPSVTNDGVTIARNICLEDEIEDLGAQTVVEACMQTNDRAGDGTTTTATLACKIISECGKKIEEEDKTKDVGGGADVVGMSRAILEGGAQVIEMLKESAKPLKKGEVKNIISTSIGKIKPEYVEPITEMIEAVGKDGYISVEDNWNTQHGVSTELMQGMRFIGSYASPFMVTNRHKEAVWENTAVLVTNWRLETSASLKSLFIALKNAKRTKVVIVCEGYDRQVIVSLAAIMAAGETGKEVIKILAIKAPSLTTEQMEDVAAYTNAKFFDKNRADNLDTVTIEDLGFAKKVVTNEDETVMTGGAGKVEDRIKTLKAHLEAEKDVAFAEQIKRRIGALTSGFGIIRVGASTEPERKYIKYKIEDAVNAAKAALEEGVVKGGGLALVEIAEKLGKKHILYTTLNAPHEKIKENAGVDEMKVPSTVVDPVKVTRLAVENACSVAAQLITSESAIANKRKSLWDEFEKKIAPALSEDSDFRSDENQEQRFRT